MNKNTIKSFIETLGSADTNKFGGKFTGGIYLQQIPDELANAIVFIGDTLALKNNINNYLEIGPASGGLTYIVNHYFKPKSILLIDTNEHPLHTIRSSVLKNIDRIEISGNSHSKFIKNRLHDYCRKYYSFNLVVIDGDHSYDGVKQDLELIKPYLNRDSLVFLHDIGESSDPQIKVSELRKEILEGSHWLEEVFATFSKEQEPLGIGLYKLKC